LSASHGTSNPSATTARPWRLSWTIALPRTMTTQHLSPDLTLWLSYDFFTCAPAMLRARDVFGGVCVSVRVFVCLSAENLENYWSKINVTW